MQSPQNSDQQTRNRQDGKSDQAEIVIHANYELFIAGLLLLQLLNSLLLAVSIPEEQRKIVYAFWFGISIFLLLDAVNRLRRSSNRQRLLLSRYGLLTWLGTVPLPFATGLRLLGMALIVRRLRRGEIREIGDVVIRKHAQTTLLFVIFTVIIFFEFGSFLILSAEHSAAGSNITTSEDAVWWSVVTISTVGYGDLYPTTRWGRLIGTALIITGVGLFTSITSYLSRWFMRPRDQQSQRLAIDADADSAHAQVSEMRSVLTELDISHRRTMAELEDRLMQLEAQLDQKQESARYHPTSK